MPRNTPFPAHIDKTRLPKNVDWDPYGGRWRYRRMVKGKRQIIRLGGKDMTLGDIHKAVEAAIDTPTDTFKTLSLRFLASYEFESLKPRTQKGYEALHKFICNRTTKSGVLLGDMPLAAWTVGAVRKYREARRAESASGAAAELRYIKRLFSWAVEYEFMSDNPAKHVTLKGLAGADRHYIEDRDLLAALIAAPYRFALAIYMGYLTGRRRTDILEATRTKNLLPGGLYFEESKTDKESFFEWTPHLRKVIDMIKEEAGDSVFLFPSNRRPDMRFSDKAADEAMKKVRLKLQEGGFTPFAFKHLRKKYSTDLEARGDDAQHNLMHTSRSTTDRHYKSKPTKVVPIL